MKAYYLPDLHAKLRLVPGRSLPVGSQNLTARGGNVNREVTVLTTEPNRMRQASEEVGE